MYDLSELPELSTKEEAFCHHVLAGETQSEAYRRVYPNSKNWKPHSLHVKACRKAAQPNIQAYLAQARRFGIQQGARNLEGYVSDLQRIQQLAIEDKQFTAAARTAELTGRALGHLSNVATDNQLGGGLGPNELVVSMRLKFGEEAGRRMAQRLGLLDEAEPVLIEGETVEISEKS